MCYYGTPLHLQCERPDRRDDVIVEQQHCGGNPLTVYSGKLTRGGEMLRSFFYIIVTANYVIITNLHSLNF